MTCGRVILALMMLGDGCCGNDMVGGMFSNPKGSFGLTGAAGRCTDIGPSETEITALMAHGVEVSL